jgi:hypothetical protein
VTLTWNVPVDVKAQDKVAIPEPVTLVGETAHDVLLVDRLTRLENPSSAVTVMFELPWMPA